MENFRRQWNLDRMAVIKILKCFKTSECRKWRNRFKIIKFVALVEYSDQQTDCSRYRREISQSRRSPLWRNQPYFLFLMKQMEPCHGVISSHPRNLKTVMEKYFWFQIAQKKIWWFGKRLLFFKIPWWQQELINNFLLNCWNMLTWDENLMEHCNQVFLIHLKHISRYLTYPWKFPVYF